MVAAAVTYMLGYARVSTAGQDPAGQVKALKAAGCDRIVAETGGGARARPALEEAIGWLRPGDTLCVTALDRIGRRTVELITLVEQLRDRGVRFRSLREGVDDGTPAGRAMLGVMAVFAQMERELLNERTRDGVAAARASGRRGGRPSKMTPAKRVRAAKLLVQPGATVSGVARTLGVSRATLYRALPDETRALGGGT